MEQLMYIRHCDYFLPNIKLNEPPPGNVPPLGVYGLRRQKYLKEHRPILYSKLLLSERLYPLLRETDEAAANLKATITDRYQAEEIINGLIYG